MPFEFLHAEKVKLQREATFNHYKERGFHLNDLELELACFRNLPFGNGLKGEFAISLAMMRWDFLYVEKDGIENYWFTRMCRAMCKYRRVFLIGSASAGKSMGMAVMGMNFWCSSPWNTTFLVTSTDKESLDAKIWGAVKDLHDKDKLKVGVRVDYEDAIVLEKNAKQRDVRDAVKAIALPKGSEGEKAIGKVQGRKNDNIIWACDEYSHMDPFVRGARSNLAAAKQFLFWAASNKPREGCNMYTDSAPDPEKYPLGWETPGLSDLHSWPTKGGGITLYFDGLNSPNTLAEGPTDPFPMLTRRDYIETIRNEEGEDSFGWWMYIRAFPRAGESHDKVINSKMLERYGALEDPVWSGTGWVTVAGFDPAWTKGGDDAMADFARVGNSFEGIKIMAHEPDAVKLRASAVSGKTFEEQIAEAFIAECKKRECHVVAIDISGGGGRVAMAVRDAATIANWRLEIISVDAAGSPSEEMYEMGDVRKTGKEAFDRRVSELLISYRLSIQQRLVKGVKMDSRAIRELCDRRASNDEKKRYTVEKKADYKKRNNGKSPDAGESRILAHVAARAHGLGAGRVTVKKSVQKQIADALKPQSDRQSAYGWSGSAKPKAYSW
jgi:hypothetical protein